MTTTLPNCPDPLPHAINASMHAAARAWFQDPACPKVEPSVVSRWRSLLRAWFEDESLPLYVRKSRDPRGAPVVHYSGREIVATDNTVAHYALMHALRGSCPSLDQIRSDVESRAIPVAMILKKHERVGCTRGRALTHRPLNDNGWKVCHIDPVRLRSNKDMGEIPMGVIRESFERLLDPGNMFLIPKTWAGLGELPEFIQAARSLSSSSTGTPR